MLIFESPAEKRGFFCFTPFVMLNQSEASINNVIESDSVTIS
jgi:hypothetical protein